MRRPSVAVALGIAALLIAGCSKRVSGPQTQTRDTGGMLIQASIRPGLPQDAANQTAAGGAQAGDNTLIVSLHDDVTNAPIGDANVSAAPSSTLVGNEQTESGRAQGNGVYYVPIRFAVPDTYDVTISIDRPRKSATKAKFTFTAS